jgi:hypothetical protein
MQGVTYDHQGQNNWKFHTIFDKEGVKNMGYVFKEY